MSVWYAIPSIRPRGGTILRHWKERGYKIAVLRQGEPIGADIEIPTAAYLGWPKSINILSRSVFERDPEAQWIVTGGDDYLPDPNHTPEEIAAECETHFYMAVEVAYPPDRPAWANIPLPSPGGSGKNAPSWKRWATFGVMQPTGDRWGEEWPQRPEWAGKPAVIDRIAGSPWLGREWCERAYGGRGPMPEEYHHLFADEELCEVAEKLGVYWRRPDLLHYHAHPLRKAHARKEDWPEFLRPIQAMWNAEQQRFKERKAAGFPGSEPK